MQAIAVSLGDRALGRYDLGFTLARATHASSLVRVTEKKKPRFACTNRGLSDVGLP